MKPLLSVVVALLMLTMLGCDESETADRSQKVPVTEMWDNAEKQPDVSEDAIAATALPRSGASDVILADDPPQSNRREAPSVDANMTENAADDDADLAVAVQPTGAVNRTAAKSRSIRVATWNPLSVRTPDWIYPAVRNVRPDGRGRHFRWYDGDYKRYTADVIREVRRLFPNGRPATLILSGWINVAHIRGGRPEGIDPHGLFTHIGDRTEAGLPGLWPNVGLNYWREANDYLFRELRAAGIDVDLIALDTEVSPHGAAGAFSFDGTHEAIISDPRWHNEPLLGFGGLTAGDIWPDPSPEPYRELWEFNRAVGRHAFATAVNEVLTARVLAHYPDALVSDYRWHTQWQHPAGQRLRQRALAIQRIMDATGAEDRWLQVGVGNAASPAFYGHAQHTRGVGDEGEPASALDAMIEYAKELIELYGSPRHVVPWIRTRGAMDRNISDETITEEQYRQYIEALVDLGIERFLWFNTSEDSLREQALTVSALEDAVASSR